MKRAQGIYIERVWGSKSKLCVCEYEMAGVKFAKVTQVIKRDNMIFNCILKKTVNEKWDRRLFRLIRKMSDKKSLIVGNELAVQTLDMTNTMFHLRKKEFQSGWETILSMLGCEGNRKEVMRRRDDAEEIDVKTGERVNIKRKKFLLILDSEEWKEKELIDIIESVKNSYEDIYVVIGDVCIDIERIKEYFFEEFGVELNLISYETARNLSVETMLLLLREWKMDYQCFWFQNSYVIVEWEKEMRRKHQSQQNDLVDKLNGMYSGFEYEIEGKVWGYNEALVLINCYNMSKEIVEKEGENPISVVAISGVE